MISVYFSLEIGSSSSNFSLC